VTERSVKRGAKPLGEKAMTGAERQARFRAKHADGALRLRSRRPADRRSHAQRWRDAVAELLALQTDYRAWLGSLPDDLQAGAMADTLKAICDLDLSELESVEPSRGFGHDRHPVDDGDDLAQAGNGIIVNDERRSPRRFAVRVSRRETGEEGQHHEPYSAPPGRG
jgi:hypothetical protein